MGNAVTNPGRFIEKKVFNVPREKSAFVNDPPPRPNYAAERRRQEKRERQRMEAQRRSDAERRRNEDLERQRREAERRRQEDRRRQEKRRREEKQRQLDERRRREEARRQQAIKNYRNEFNGYSNNARDLQCQISAKQQELQREEKIDADLTQQRNAERAVLVKFTQERSDTSLARIVLVGETGVGKSTLANRLIGDNSRYCDSSSAVFRVSNGIHSQPNIQKEVRNVTLPSGKRKRISVIDTPGLSDSENRDRHHANVLCEYLRGVERVHLFVIVFSSANPRLDDATIRGLHHMMMMFGRNFWRFVTIMYTNVDDARTRAALPRNSTHLQARIRGELGLRGTEAPLNVIGIGIDDWQEGVMELIEKTNTGNFYTCESLQSPFQQLEENVVQQSRKVKTVRSALTKLNSRLKTVQGNVQRIRSALRGYGVHV